MTDSTTSKIFVSYSRADTGFVDDLVAGLEADGAFAVLIDREGIGHGEDWQARLGALILECDTMVFVMSPDSLQSEICAWEVEEALRVGRRIVPVLWRVVDFDAAPPGLSALNAVPFIENQVIRGLAKLTVALKTDLDWLRAQSALSARAEEWGARDKTPELLLRGAPLSEAQDLLARRPASAPETPALLTAYLAASAAEEERVLEDQARQIAELQAAIAVANGARRRIRAWLAVAVVALIGALSAGGYAFVQQQEATKAAARADAEAAAAKTARLRAERNFATAERAINSLIFDIAQDLENIEGVSLAALRRILGQAQTALDRLLASDPTNRRLLRSKAAAHIKFGDVYAKTGNGDAALAAYEEGLRISRKLAKAEPENTLFQRDVSVSLERIGNLRLRRGEADAALTGHEEALRIRRKLAKAAPENTQFQRGVSVSLGRIGDLRLRRGEADAALAAYEEGLAIARKLAKAAPENTLFQRDVSLSLMRIGDLRLRRGAADAALAALAAYEEGLAINRKLARAEPENTQFQRDVSVSLDSIGNLRLRQGEADAALAAYDEALRIRRKLAKAEPKNTLFQRDVSLSLVRIGDLRLRRGEADAALAAYEEALRIFRKLAKAEPENTLFQYEMGFSLTKVGDLRLRRSEADAALAAYEEGLRISRKLAKAEPENTLFQRDVSLSLERIGDLRRRRGEADAARAAYEETLTIARKLAKAEPENTLFQRDVSLSLERIGDLRLRRGEADAALAAYEEALRIRRKLAKAEPSSVRARSDIVRSLVKVASATKGAKKLAALREALKRVDKLRAAGLLSASQKTWPDIIRRALARAEAEVAFSEAFRAAKASKTAFAAKAYTKAAAEAQKALVAFDRALPKGAKLNEKAKALKIGLLSRASFYLQFSRNFAEAEKLARAHAKLEPDSLIAQGNLANARLFQGDSAGARKIYLRYVGKKLKDGRDWAATVAEDFAALRKAGVSHPEMDAIIEAMAAKARKTDDKKKEPTEAAPKE
ncbi:MAG: TIR domain-containing protein [Neomegalonema sp.]|nr:TIR domain-containing protein [Neomegalonema sp.]